MSFAQQNNVQHWDKIVFVIRTPNLNSKVNLPVNSELDIKILKILDDPHNVADIKQKVLAFLEVPNEPRSSIQIANIEYSITCNTTASSNTGQYSGSTATTAPPPNNPPPTMFK